MEMEDQYGLADLRHYMNGRPIFSADLLTSHQSNLTQAQAQAQAQQQQHYDMMMVGRGVHEFRSDSATTTTTASLSGGLEMEIGGGGGGGGGVGGGGDGGNGRWPRQETLTLLEIRSRLDSKFKEANQKGPLWDEVSRIMSGEHGYQRSGKKCREKFENLYKYYKKTKEGKAGRQDGKHYRFFRQLEALYGETSNPTLVSETHLIDSSFRFNSTSNNNTTQPNQEPFQPPRLCDSLSLSNSSGFDTCSSEDSDLNAGGGLMDNDSMEKRKKRRGKRSWKVKIRDFIDAQMRKLMEKQEAWFEKMMNAIENKEQERMLREEEWRKQEAARIDREHKFWANERAWIEARDASLMEALQKLTGNINGGGENHNDNASETITNNVKGDSWPECEITKLIQLRSSMEPRFSQSGCSEEIMWEEIGSKMACLGYDRSGLMCKDKWDSINNYIMMKTKDCGKKRKENSRSCCYNESICNQGGGYCQTNESNAGNAMHDSCFRFLMGADAENLWDNYDVKLSKGENH